MPLQATSGAASYDGFGGGVVAEPNYIESCFSTYLYTGNGSTQTITNGIDLSGKGGLVWLKDRTTGTAGYDHTLIDTVRGSSLYINSNLTAAQTSNSTVITGFNSNGFGIGSNTSTNVSLDNFVSWTFREQPKFFDVVTYTGDGLTGKVISHNLGSVPGCIIFKRTDSTSDWAVYHRSLNGGVGPEDYRIFLNTTAAQTAGPSYTVASVGSTSFTLGSNGAGGGSALTNVSGATYVAYVFAHNAGGFGLTGTDNVITCGTYSGSASGFTSVTLGYEPQWVLTKSTNFAGAWKLSDNMRGIAIASGSGTGYILSPNSTSSENTSENVTGLKATGFVGQGGTGEDYIYIAIRRGPMKVPTSGTSVFEPVTYSGNNADTLVGTLNPVDLGIVKARNNASTGNIWGTRLTGNQFNNSAGTGGNSTSASIFPANVFNASQVGMTVGSAAAVNASSYNYVDWSFKRAPNFMDVVCYTGTGATTTFNHNLGVVPELMIVKRRDTTGNWVVYSKDITSGDVLFLNSTAASSGGASSFNSTAPTSSVFTVGTGVGTNASGGTFVNYLFATCAGVSKVGLYTGNGVSTGDTQNINCGFVSGARFVLIKCTSNVGDWIVFDTARGIVSGADPWLLLNSTAAEGSSDELVPASNGFTVRTAASGKDINVSGRTYIYLAIA